jgi:hypothetical protein
MRRQILKWAVLAAGFTTAVHAGTMVTFSFEDVPGKVTTFSDTISGLTATFTSSGDPTNQFSVGAPPIPFQDLTGQVLSDDVTGLSLIITFDQLINSISMNFALETLDTTVGFNLEAFNGATSVGSSGPVMGTIPGCCILPEGVIGFSGPNFDKVVLSSGTSPDTPAAPAFAIDNVVVDPPVGTPEPGTVLLSAVLGGLILRLKARR